MPVTFESGGPADTRKLGERLSRLLQAGDIVLLSGDLGAGKTCLAQGIGRGLHVAEAVKSSSFVLVNEYNGRLKVYHADLFRLNEAEEVAELALEEMSAAGVLLIEWPDRAWREMPPERLLVRIEITGDRRRQITIDGAGVRYKAIVAGLSPARAGRRGA